jgi:DNA invertase Pin-like site-specific DNA recombinase
MGVDVGVWFRVSDGRKSDEANQYADVDRFLAAQGYREVLSYTIQDSAWKDGGGPEYKVLLKEALDDAWRGEFKILVVWALDRITRNGAEDALRLIRQFRERGCIIVSVKESWLNTSPEIQDVLVSFAGWMAQQESKRRSERVKAGIAKRKAQGLPVGRMPGAKDVRPRRRSGYVRSWEQRRAG